MHLRRHFQCLIHQRTDPDLAHRDILPRNRNQKWIIMDRKLPSGSSLVKSNSNASNKLYLLCGQSGCDLSLCDPDRGVNSPTDWMHHRTTNKDLKPVSTKTQPRSPIESDQWVPDSTRQSVCTPTRDFWFWIGSALVSNVGKKHCL